MSDRARIRYRAIATVDVNEGGDLRLFQRTWLRTRKQIVFHPTGEWRSVTLHPNGDCDVIVR